MTRSEVVRLRDQLEAALGDLDIPGFTFKLGNAKFGASVIFQLEACPTSEDGTVVTKEADDFEQLAGLYGLKATDLGRTFKTGGREYTIRGANPRSRRTPILADRDDGKGFRFPTETVKALLAVAK